jgi:hypothetical protein
MPTGHYAFRLLKLEQQLPLVWEEGTYLAQRWEEEDTVALYHMAGNFFCEVYYDEATNALLRTATFRSLQCLFNYTPYIYLDDLTGLLY